MGQLDASIVTLALPTLQRQFHSGLGAVTWVGLSYLLVLVSLVAAVGHFADMVGRKLLYVYGFAVFAVGSALCALAPDLVVLDLCRGLQAVGAAMMQANSVAIIYAVMPADRLGRGIGVQGAAQALGLALGPTVGGALIALGGWRLVFWVNVPVGVIGGALGWFLIPRSRNLRGRLPFDWLGLLLLVPAVAAFLAGVSLGNDVGWTSPVIVFLLAAAAVLAGVFVAFERGRPFAVIDLDLFRRRAFSSGVGSGLLSYLTLFGVLFVMPFFLERSLHYGTGRTGLVLTAVPMALGLAAPLAGRAADRLGSRPLTAPGMVVAGVALVLLTAYHRNLAAVVGELAAFGLGLGIFTPPNNASIMAAAPPDRSGMAGGILNMTRGAGTALGLAVTSLVFGLWAGTAGGRSAERGLEASALVLAGVAGVAALLAALRPDQRAGRKPSTNSSLVPPGPPTSRR